MSSVGSNSALQTSRHKTITSLVSWTPWSPCLCHFRLFGSIVRKRFLSRQMWPCCNGGTYQPSSWIRWKNPLVSGDDTELNWIIYFRCHSGGVRLLGSPDNYTSSMPEWSAARNFLPTSHHFTHGNLFLTSFMLINKTSGAVSDGDIWSSWGRGFSGVLISWLRSFQCWLNVDPWLGHFDCEFTAPRRWWAYRTHLVLMSPFVFPLKSLSQAHVTIVRVRIWNDICFILKFILCVMSFFIQCI